MLFKRVVEARVCAIGYFAMMVLAFNYYILSYIRVEWFPLTINQFKIAGFIDMAVFLFD